MSLPIAEKFYIIPGLYTHVSPCGTYDIVLSVGGKDELVAFIERGADWEDNWIASAKLLKLIEEIRRVYCTDLTATHNIKVLGGDKDSLWIDYDPKSQEFEIDGWGCPTSASSLLRAIVICIPKIMTYIEGLHQLANLTADGTGYQISTKTNAFVVLPDEGQTGWVLFIADSSGAYTHYLRTKSRNWADCILRVVATTAELMDRHQVYAKTEDQTEFIAVHHWPEDSDSRGKFVIDWKGEYAEYSMETDKDSFYSFGACEFLGWTILNSEKVNHDL